MNLDELDVALERAAIVGAHRNYVAAVSRPRVELLPSSMPASLGRSRIGGGAADLPRGATWPCHPGGPYRFLLQVNLAELPARIDALPREGLVAFFVANDEETELFWQDPNYVHALYLRDHNGLQTVAPPTGATRGGDAHALRFEVGMDLPHDACQRTDWPSPELAGVLVEWWRERERATVAARWGYLLGYPAVSTLAYDPTPGPEWTPLLSLDTVDSLELWWHDGGPLHVFGRRDRLRVGDLSELAADSG